MAISKFSQRFGNSGCSRRVRFPLGILLGSVAWVILAGPAWSADSTSTLKDSYLQNIAVSQDVDPLEQSAATSESVPSPNAIWQVEIAYVVSKAEPFVSQE
jgi:hypothetical protein